MTKAGQGARRWISVEDDLPDRHQRVLIWFRSSGREWRAEFGERTYDGHWRPEGGNGNFDDYVTHWMPIPEAPEAR